MALVQRNVAVDPDVWARLKTEAVEKNKNLREFAGEILVEYTKKRKFDALGKPKAIILGAGTGTRLMPLTKKKPKCMLEIRGKPILQRNVETLKKCDMNDIIFIKGYKKEAINYPELKYYYNSNYMNNNVLESLFYAESEMDREFLAIYSDILFEKSVVDKLLQSREDISIVVDTDWRSHYEGRAHHPIEEAEKVMAENGGVTKITKYMNPNNAYGEFIGMAKFSEYGAAILRSTYKTVQKQYNDKPFHDAVSIEKAYLTDMFQELIDRGYDIHSIDIRGGWKEIDTLEDFQKAGGKV